MRLKKLSVLLMDRYANYWKKVFRFLSKVFLERLANIFGPQIEKNGYCEFNKPIFMIGCPKSGTSITARILGSHPDLATWIEAGRVWDNKNFYNGHSDHIWDSSDITNEDYSRIRGGFYLYKQLLNKNRIFNKHPRNSLRIKYIKEVFPDALFVQVVRHPVPVVESLSRHSESFWRSRYPYGLFCKPPQWRKFQNTPPLIKHSYQWEEILKYSTRNLNKLRTNFLTIKYESFCANPKKEVKRFSNFVGLNSSKYPTDIKSKYSVENKNFKARNHLSKNGLNKVWEIVQGAAKNYGYDLNDI